MQNYAEMKIGKTSDDYWHNGKAEEVIRCPECGTWQRACEYKFINYKLGITECPICKEVFIKDKRHFNKLEKLNK